MTEPLQEQPETPAEQPTADKQVKTERTFTQQELNEHVQSRLARATKDFDRERLAWETERQSLESGHKDLQKLVKNAVINVITARMDETTKRTFEALPFDEQLKLVQDETYVAGLNQRTVVPETPKSTAQKKPLFKRTQPI